MAERASLHAARTSIPLVLVLQGPTASGKTVLAHALADAFPLEIISADSRQVYRGLDIGTAKPTEAERKRYHYYGIDLCTPDQSISAGQFARWAWEWIGEIAARGKAPIIVGGSGLYVRAITEGLFEEPGRIPPAIRSRLAERLLREGRHALYAELERVDPESAARYSDHNPRRILRALEFYYAHGIPLSYAQNIMRQQPPPMRIERITLLPERPALYGRIAHRVRHMWEAGLTDEMQRLLSQGYNPNLPIFETIGYAEALMTILGRLDRSSAIERTIVRTRRYAKRQITWLRNSTPLGVVLPHFGDEALNRVYPIIDQLLHSADEYSCDKR
jgi:tRNA dimethylallyltransferase